MQDWVRNQVEVKDSSQQILENLMNKRNEFSQKLTNFQESKEPLMELVPRQSSLAK